MVATVDGSKRNGPAVDWAVELAERSGRRLVLVTVVDDDAEPVSHQGVVTDSDRHWSMLRGSAAGVAARHRDVEVRPMVKIGSAVARLVEVSADEHVLVVGKRGLGSLGRTVIGSVSIGVAGRAQVPVVVVPDDWDATRHTTAPVLVGVDPGIVDDRPLRFAFTEAQRRGVELVAAHSLDLSPELLGDRALGAAVYGDWTAQSTRLLEETVAPLREEFPDVATKVVHAQGHPGGVLLDQAGSGTFVPPGDRLPCPAGARLRDRGVPPAKKGHPMSTSPVISSTTGHRASPRVVVGVDQLVAARAPW